MFYDRKVGICRGRPSCRVGVYVFYNRLRYYCTNINTEVLYPLERAKVFAVPPLLVQTISLGDKANVGVGDSVRFHVLQS